MLYPKDPSIRIDRLPDAIAVSWRRSKAEAIPFLLIGVLMEFCGLMIGFTPRPDGVPKTLGEELGFLGFMSLLGIPMLYGGLAFLINTTTLRADRSVVSCKTGPLWTGENKSVSAKGVKQYFSPSTPSGSHRTPRTLYVMDANDHVWPLAKNLPNSFAANQVCHELADYYGIPDLPVFGVTTDPHHPGPRSLPGKQG